MYADVVEARAKLKVKGKKPEKIHLRPERMRELSKNVHTPRWTSILDSEHIGMKSDMELHYAIISDERVVAEDGTVEILPNQIPSLLR